MEDRTRQYLQGRFRDHYRRSDVDTPPKSHHREWAYIPWDPSDGTTMIRHLSTIDFGTISEFLHRERPKHVFYSAGYYERPGATSMQAKRWNGADLIFDLDADHLPGVVPGEDSYGGMLETCKKALYRLLDFLEDDFGFQSLTIAFSGGRGYHVHVRDDAVKRLERDHRREIVDYVRGIGIDFESIVTEEPVAGLGRRTPARKRSLGINGGWSRRTHRYLSEAVDEILAMGDESAIDRLETYEGIGAQKSRAILRTMRENYSAITEGNIDVHPAFYQFAKLLISEAVAKTNAPIDEPVTTDTNRLIRLPGTLHGGSGLRVCPLDRDLLDEFDPLIDAIPETFREHEISVDVESRHLIELGGSERTIDAGSVRVPEYQGIFLMARGLAEKGSE